MYYDHVSRCSTCGTPAIITHPFTGQRGCCMLIDSCLLKSLLPNFLNLSNERKNESFQKQFLKCSPLGFLSLSHSAFLSVLTDLPPASWSAPVVNLSRIHLLWQPQTGPDLKPVSLTLRHWGLLETPGHGPSKLICVCFSQWLMLPYF